MFAPLRSPVLLLSCCLTGCVEDDVDKPASDDTATDTATEPSADRPAPDTAGPHPVGTRADDIVTPTGQPLTIQTWYPAPDGTTGDPHAYGGLITGAALDAPTPDCSTVRPVMVFSHGNSGLRYQSIFLTEHLATRGWVVVAPDHEGNTAFDIDTARWGELAVRRPIDLSQSFDWLIGDLAGAGGPLEGCVDPDDGFAVVGHSFGGYTAVAITTAQLSAEVARACDPGWLCGPVADFLEAHPELGAPDLRDDRVWASVPMTPAAYELLAPSLEDSAVPTLVMGGSYDDITPMAGQVTPIYAGLGAIPKHLATFETAGHYTFSDACTLIPTYPDCGEDYLDIPTAHQLIRGSTTAFLESVAGLPVDTTGWLPLEDDLVVWESVE